MLGTLFGLPIHIASRWIFNCYILGDPDVGITFIDPGLPSVAADAMQFLGNEFGSEIVPDRLMSTHAHPDHVGGIPHVLERCDASVHLPRLCEQYLDGETPRRFGLESSIRFLPVMGDQKFEFSALREFAKAGRSIGFGGPKEFTIPFTPTGYLSEMVPPSGMNGWEVIEAPGHTDDSTCLYHHDTATLLAGDAVVTLDGRAWFNPEWVDVNLSDQTEAKLRSLEVRHLLPGHGHPIEAPDVWSTAKSFRDKPEGKGLLARCSRRIGRWNF